MDVNLILEIISLIISTLLGIISIFLVLYFEIIKPHCENKKIIKIHKNNIKEIENKLNCYIKNNYESNYFRNLNHFFDCEIYDMLNKIIFWLKDIKQDIYNFYNLKNKNFSIKKYDIDFFFEKIGKYSEFYNEDENDIKFKPFKITVKIIDNKLKTFLFEGNSENKITNYKDPLEYINKILYKKLNLKELFIENKKEFNYNNKENSKSCYIELSDIFRLINHLEIDLKNI